MAGQKEEGQRVVKRMGSWAHRRSHDQDGTTDILLVVLKCGLGAQYMRRGRRLVKPFEPRHQHKSRAESPFQDSDLKLSGITGWALDDLRLVLVLMHS
jgi:hypothetical protein